MNWMKKTLGRSVAVTLILAGVFFGFWIMAKPYLKTQITAYLIEKAPTAAPERVSPFLTIDLAEQKGQETERINSRIELLGLWRGLGVPAEKCDKFLKRVIKNPKLMTTISYAKAKKVTITLSDFFSTDAGMIHININASDEDIIKYLKTGKKPWFLF